MTQKVESKRGFILRLKEAGTALFGTPKEPMPFTRETGKAVLGMVEQTYGIFQVPSFRDQVTTFWNDPLIREGVTMFSEQVVSTGFFLTANKEYTNKLPITDAAGNKIGDFTALEAIQWWCDENNVDIKLLEIAIELRAFGNSFWRLDEHYGFAKIPIEAIWRAVPLDPSTPLQLKYDLQLVPYYGAKTINWGEFIHFRTNVTGYKAPLGVGILFSLLTKPVDSEGDTAPSIYDVRMQMRKSLHEGFKKFSFGNELWIFEGMSNEDFAEQGIGEKISKMSNTGNRVATNTRGKIEIAVPERTQSYDQFIKTMQDEFFMSLADPSLKLGLEQGFTKSTAVVASSFYQNKVSNARRSIKQQFDDLFKLILNKLGYDGTNAAVQMNFGPEEKAGYQVKDIFNAVQLQVISRDEARKLLTGYHKWDINGTAPPLEKPTNMNIMGSTKSDGRFGEPRESELEKRQITKKEGLAEPQVIITELADSLAGYNADFSKVFIDKLVPQEMHETILAHEADEYHSVMDGRTWEYAHRLATAWEHFMVLEKGMSWEEYNSKYLDILRQIRARGSKNPEGLLEKGGKSGK